MSKTQDTLDEGMTVAQLIKMLKKFNPDTLVVFAYPYGDRRSTQVASNITEVELQSIDWSEYHNSLQVTDGGETKALVIS